MDCFEYCQLNYGVESFGIFFISLHGLCLADRKSLGQLKYGAAHGFGLGLLVGGRYVSSCT